MREIKFRAWDKINKKMYHWGEFRLKTQDTGWAILFNKQNIKRTNCILMQFTGLKDKHEVEIYEGDIIKYDLYETENYPPQVGIIKWSDYFCRLGISDINGRFDIELRKDLWIEKVGNIYEHPEL